MNRIALFSLPGWSASLIVASMIVAVLAVGVCGAAQAQGIQPAPVAPLKSGLRVSQIPANEVVSVYAADSAPSPDGKNWQIAVHVRVWKPEYSIARKAIALRAMRFFGVATAHADETQFDRRIDLLLGEDRSERRVVLSMAGFEFELPPTRSDGHTEALIEIPAEQAQNAAVANRLAMHVRLPPSDRRTFAGEAHHSPDGGVSVISDIDDTVKVTHVTDKKKLLEATFFKPFEAVDGMAAAYRRWALQGVHFHYVSSSPWQLYEPLASFFATAGFPPGILTLKRVRFSDRTIRNLFADPLVTKPPVIEALLKRHPRRTFVLVGDTGEKDPEIYGAVLRRHPSRISRVLIRNVTGETSTNGRMRAAFAGSEPARWQLFDKADEIQDALVR